ncbi:metal-dependent transcriptional regulator [Helcococcus sueciensis]|uniref:metal-dependent transcriptional regulator n=1 Tax=Helcococcus sueciensis TaxID=241555 RepID=UPI00047F068D|nr:metal-dependent transcriptional regulator [Helcococcus sueciensis]
MTKEALIYNPQREEYLISIFKLMQTEDKITNKMLSENLDLAPSSVTEMLKKLKEEGFVEKGKSNRLTPEGEDITKKILSKHRLWEYFLEKTLEFDWKEVHEHAQKFQSVTNDDMLEKLNKFLGYPEYCPHGSTIYINNEETNDDLINMSEAKINTNYIVRRIRDERTLLKYLEKIGLKIGEKIKIIEFEQFDDSAIVDIEGEKISVSSKAYKLIYLKEVHH